MIAWRASTDGECAERQVADSADTRVTTLSVEHAGKQAEEEYRKSTNVSVTPKALGHFDHGWCISPELAKRFAHCLGPAPLDGGHAYHATAP